MPATYEAIIIGGGVVGASTAFHLAELGLKRVLVLERGEIAGGGTGQSCAIVRSHYSVPSNTELAVRSLEMFRDFTAALKDPEAASGFVNTGYLILAKPGEMAATLVANLGIQRELGAATWEITAAEALELHPLLNLDDVGAIGYESDSGYADPHLTTASFINAARRLGVEIKTGVSVTGLLIDGDAVKGVRTSDGKHNAGVVVSAIGPWTHTVGSWIGLDIPLENSRHTVLTLRTQDDYREDLPIVKDLTTSNKMYLRPETGGTVLVGTGDHGEPIQNPDDMNVQPAPDLIEQQTRQIAHRMPSFDDARLVDSWFGPYDITPDWNPVLDAAPGVEGLLLAFGFSGHGFKLAPMVGKVLAQRVLGMPTDVDITPYRYSRFDEGALLTGAYGIGSIS